MKHNILILFSLLSFPAVIMGGCSTTSSDGKTQANAGLFPDDKAHEDAAFRNVRERAPFDLGCEDAALTRLGDVARLGGQMTRTNIGAVCGEKRGTYVVTCVSNWGDISCTPEMNTLVNPN